MPQKLAMGRASRRRVLPLLSLAASAWCALRSARSFVAGPPVGAVGLRGAARVTRGAQPQYGPLDDELINEILYPKEQMWQMKSDGNVLQELYPGAREPTSIFWALIQPAAAFGFLVIGTSAYFGEPIVDWNPVTKALFPFLRNLNNIQWVPQGQFMSFYGFFGLFIFGPIQWYLVSSNKGRGCAEFDKRTRRFTIVRDGELLTDMSFDDIQLVRFEWTNLSAFGAREVYLITNDNEEVHFMDTLDELPKRVLEKRAAQLAEFLGKDLDIDEAEPHAPVGGHLRESFWGQAPRPTEGSSSARARAGISLK
eukprot:CAMPEP_0197897436 /NCGR_PEP_ID=MMETSP1439-20131203/42182_1 /TAXON_ID=66791 /ORGANISM="Gonyaulax spinifera, Strain CCMP409" /LENGTH=309 /DNA_ID=CAMNT_0043518067 /DNA_START=59 /DNA_END=986 /DNA_ORIENTATION=+